MRGRPRKIRKSDSKESPVFNKILSPPAAEVSIFDNLSNLSLPALESEPITPRRCRGRKKRTQEAISVTSTPVHRSSTSNISLSSPRADEEPLEYAEFNTQPKTPEDDPPCHKSKPQKRKSQTFQPKQKRQRRAVEQTQKNGTPTKRRCGRTRKNKTRDAKGNGTQPSKRLRPRFELQKPDTAEQDDSLLSSDLSIELNHDEEQLPSLPLQENESEDEEEEDLPSFLMQKNNKPPSITEGAFVWGRCRNYPYWPALVKNVNRRQKKASVMFVDQAFTGIQKQKGFTLPLKTLKPFDCEEADELMQKAKESYEAAITWSLEFIEDYRMRIACGSFSGSFIEYCNHDMSYPVRRKYPQAASERLTITSSVIMEEPCEHHQEDRVSEKYKDVSTCSKRLLPDRTHAAHNRANEKLVHFIVKQRMVEKHLLAVIRGQQESRWLRSFLSAKRRRVVNIYLEDDQQLDRVYWYLNELYVKAVPKSPRLADVKLMEHVPFVLDVLLPEAIIYAIAGVDNVSVKKAEEKYLKGRCISNRERQEFDLMIERQMWRKSQLQNTGLELFSDSIS
ncbi:PWWP domain-containing protein MUM1-like isoform X1 [Xiphophorus maculatus]|uniref:PWWP domain-containing protein MUM1-like isoform X1 n=1 Tax=Xiphophorus maculatus TaxID=8083 RepID=UPI000293D336|nr:PWWP domain-containing protein MUM1-like isoform X1 [Xiphophorus maculatus]XP_023187828.1 PWWP domain-containing protein MUM1-like isoform X1 [Xiphophorus maculatus]